MVDIPGAAADAAAIHAAFASDVVYTGAGLTAGTVSAVRSDAPGDAFMGPGETVRTVSFEFQQSSFSGVPAKGDTINDGDAWTVIDITRRNDVNAWVMIVEASS